MQAKNRMLDIFLYNGFNKKNIEKSTYYALKKYKLYTFSK